MDMFLYAIPPRYLQHSWKVPAQTLVLANPIIDSPDQLQFPVLQS
jgi:hypothetical protein